MFVQSASIPSVMIENPNMAAEDNAVWHQLIAAIHTRQHSGTVAVDAFSRNDSRATQRNVSPLTRT